MSLIPVLEIIRLSETEQGTLGVLRIQKECFCVTLELPDRLNQPSRSSIPAQQYICQRHTSPKFEETFRVLDVPGREAILFHPGNVVEDTEGCILLGQYFGKLRGDRAILNSGNTFRAFMEALEGNDTAHLTIKEEY